MVKKQSTAHGQLVYMIILCLTSLWQHVGVSQSSSSTAKTSRKAERKLTFGEPIPLTHLYWHFFIYQEHLDQAAAQKEKEGKDGRWLRDHFEKELNFSNSDFAIVRATADAVVLGVADLDKRANVIVASDRAAIKAHSVSPGSYPPGFQQLTLLTQDREQLFRSQIGLMNDKLGSVKAEALANYLKQTFASNIKRGSFPHVDYGTSLALPTATVSK